MPGAALVIWKTQAAHPRVGKEVARHLAAQGIPGGYRTPLTWRTGVETLHGYLGYGPPQI